MKAQIVSKPPLLRNYFFMASIIMLVIMSLAGLSGWSLSLSQKKEQATHYQRGAHHIEQVLTETFSYIENFCAFIGKKILQQDPTNLKSIETILQNKWISSETNQELFSWTLFDFVTPDGYAVVTSSQGILAEPKKVRDRSWLYDAPRRPWKLHFSHPAVGFTSGEWVLPLGYGIADKNGVLLGILSAGFNIQKLTRLVERSLDTENISFVILNDNMEVVAQSLDNFHTIKKDFFTPWLGVLDKSAAKAGPLASPIRYNDITYQFYKKLDKYPYIILVGESNNVLQDKMIRGLLPLLLQSIGIIVVLQIVLYLIYHRIITPAVILSDIADRISRGEENIDIPMGKIYTFTNLSTQLRNMMHYIEEIKSMKLELGRKNKELERAKNSAVSAKETALSASKAKSDFLASTAHELRTPLGQMIVLSEYMKAELFGKMSNPKYLDYANEIHLMGKESLQFIEDLLDEAQAGSGNFEIKQREEVSITDIIKRAVKLTVSNAYKNHIVINTEAPEDLPLLYVDPRRIRQILVNLISNAIKYSPEHTVITVLSRTIGRRLEVSVIDQGFGMSAMEIETALKRFGKVLNQNSGKVDSIGLGLPLVKHLAEVHGAEFNIQSESGKGTIVSIIFPPECVRWQEGDRLSVVSNW